MEELRKLRRRLNKTSEKYKKSTPQKTEETPLSLYSDIRHERIAILGPVQKEYT
jgi:hypothetical protein